MKTIEVQASKAYEVCIETGLLDHLGEACAPFTSGKVLVVTDENVAPLYLARAYQSLTQAGLKVFTLCLPAGEQTKSAKYYVNLLELLAEKQLTRSDLLIALGGGVIGDLSGFAAATYLRGIRLVQVPTTLLAMVDSSVGGKTAIDLAGGKNLAGAFYQPSLVLCDPKTLDTLPAAVFQDGCAEVIKTAILFDPALFAHLQKQGLAFDREETIAACVRHKRDVVCADEFDTGLRQLLNLGHTIGHAVESCSNYAVSHGQAVAIGTAMMARARCADREEILSLLKTFGLPVSTEFSSKALAQAAQKDKKRVGDTITCVIPHAIGNCTLEPLPAEALEALIRQGMP